MEVPRYWRQNAQRYQLTGSVCLNCEEKHFPPRSVCPDCGTTAGNHASSVQKVEHTVSPVTPSAKITNPEYHGIPVDPNGREVTPHSQTLKNEILIGENEIPGLSKEKIVYNSMASAD